MVSKEIKSFLVLSVLLNLYLICIFFFPRIFSFGGGRVVQCGIGNRASLISSTDIFGVNRHYVFTIRNEQDQTEYLIRIYTQKVIFWPYLREDHGALRYDCERNEVIIDVDDRPIRISVNGS